MRLQRGYTEYRLFDRREPQIDGTPVIFRDARHARQFLAELLENDAAFGHLRGLIAVNDTGTPLRLADRGEVLGLAAELILRDRLLVTQRSYRPLTRVVWEPESASAAPVKTIAPKAAAKTVAPKTNRPRIPVPNNDPGWEPQRQALKSASKNGVPFCEECAKKAAAAMLAATAHAPAPKLPIQPPPAQQNAVKEVPKCGKGLTCAAVKASVSCSHDARQADASTRLLEVAPSESGDRISMQGPQRTTCGTPMKWSVSGFSHHEKQGQNASFLAERWIDRAILGTTWLNHVTPRDFHVQGRTECGQHSANYTIRCYPSDKYAISFNATEWAKMGSTRDYIEDVLSAYLKEFKFDFAGKGEISAVWQEDKNSHKAFYSWKASVGFDPLIGSKLRIPFGPTTTVPQFIKKYGDAYFFVEFSGGVSLIGEWGRLNIGKVSGNVKGTGYLRGKIGGSLFLMSKSVVSLEVAGSSGIAFEAQPDMASYDHPAVVGQFKWEGIKANVTIAVWKGVVEINREFLVCDEKDLGGKHVWQWG